MSETNQVNVGVIVGHTKDNQGAVAYNGVSEYVFNKVISKFMYQRSKIYRGANLHVMTRDESGIKGAALRAKLMKCNMTIELHFNSFFKKASGIEILICKDYGWPIQDYAASYRFAEVITQKFSTEEKYNFRLRHGDGVKPIGQKDRGFNNLSTMHLLGKVPVALLIEPNFMNYESDEARSIMNDPRGYAYFLTDIIFKKIYGLGIIF